MSVTKPGDQDPVRYPELSPQLRDRSLMGMLKLFGPGAIIASVTIGSGETVFASRGGAVFGYSLFWCFLVGSALKGLQVYTGARFITLTGRHPLRSWMELPGPRGWFVLFVSVMTIVWMPFWVGGGLPKMLGEFTNWVVGFPDPDNASDYVFFGRLWGTFFILVALTFTWVQSYGFLERVQTVLVGLLLLCMVLAAAVSNPDLLALLGGTLIPTRPRYDGWVLERFAEFRGRNPWVEMVTYLGAVGGGTQDYLGYVGMLREEGWGLLGIRGGGPLDAGRENLKRGLAWLRAPRTDVTVSFTCIFIFTLCFAVLGATILYPRQEIPSGFDLLTLQLGYLVRPDQSPLVQTLLAWLYKTG
ncbi:MAG: Nramp family divalent metal transporter, partial [Candidatus Aminicenantes bacterium]|nr:Nramp family divalent metal transporter [Candidatus Aminicenantes bacterium]